MNEKRIFPWLTLDMVIFVAINVFLIMYFGDKLSVLGKVDYFQLLVLGLAAYRSANILSTEVVTKPLRAPFVDKVMKNGKAIEKPKPKGFLGAFGLLIYCPSCTGVWLSAVLVYSYIFWPVPTFFVAFILALSGIERIICNVLLWFKSNA